MEYTREPVIETVIAPKEGFKLVIRSSKLTGQSEYFVDAIEIVSFGNAVFYRSMDRAKPFLLPTSDYELVEVKEARMVLKSVGLRHIGGDRTIKISSPKEAEDVEDVVASEPTAAKKAEAVQDAAAAAPRADKTDRKKERRKGRRGRRKDDGETEEGQPSATADEAELPTEGGTEAVVAPPVPRPHLLLPPPSLISETLSRYRDNDAFKGAFYEKEAQMLAQEHPETPKEPLPSGFETEDEDLFGTPRQGGGAFIEEIAEESGEDEPFGFNLDEDMEVDSAPLNEEEGSQDAPKP